ncbi:N-acetylmuramoyl-L-alanine amidase [Hyalangium gracile]|uniref:N-acetylmuramoyl-L-alanine amidase n=1 Tax=Hyalangium gracile TaxID=394092 RepID=UPI001CCF6A42|nr:N-acetylmuramoyl-L-alanine amidase [Hyalangium gracile]
MPSNEYRVKSGDTLSAIARRHDVAVDVLARTNGISDVNRIYVGQVLKLPEPVTAEQLLPAQSPTHRVLAGEKLEDIALEYVVSVEELREANGLSETDAIFMGQVLTLPQKTPATETKPLNTQGRTTTSEDGAPTINEVMEVAFRITGAFEGGQAKAYQNKDSGIVSYGKHQATLASGTLGIILQKYVDQSQSVTAKQLSVYMPKVNKKDESLREDAGFKKLLLAAADDALMGTIQDAVFAEKYWPAAEKGAKADKLESPLALAMYYDTNIQGGLSDVRTSTATSLKGKDYTEAEWLKEFNTQRDLRLKRLAEKRSKAAKDPKKSAKEKQSLEKDAAMIEGSRSRVKDLQKLVTDGDLQLKGDKDGKILANGKWVDGLKSGGGKTSEQGGTSVVQPGGVKTSEQGGTSVVQVEKPAVVSKPSANYGSRGSTKIDAIIMHHTASNNAAQDLVQLTKKGTGVSAHYLIAPDGTVYQLVDDDKRAWHAGVSAIREEKTDVNSRSIGIELTNDGLGKTPFTEEQYEALEKLVPYLAVTYDIPMENILGHRDVAPKRKTDPADNFDWPRVRKAVTAARSGTGTGTTTDSKPKTTVVTTGSTGNTTTGSTGNTTPLSGNFNTALKDWITLHEDRRYQVYTDTKGHPTVGIGFNLDREGAQQSLKALGVDYAAVKAGRTKLTDAQIDALFEADVKGVVETARTLLGQKTYDALNDARKIVVLDMIFNLGATGFGKFKKLIQALQRTDYQAAALEMEDSLWYGQVGRRSKNDVASMRTGTLSSTSSGTKGSGSTTQKPVEDPKKKTEPTKGTGKKPSQPTQAVDLNEIARNVHGAVSGIGTDEQTIYTNLARLNYDERLIKEFKSVYQSLYGVDVVADLKADLSNSWWGGSELDRALAYLTPGGSSQEDDGGEGFTIDSKNAYIVKLATGKLTTGADGTCVTQVRTNMTALGVPTYSTTGNDPNNSRGAMVQLLNSGQWESVPIAGSEQRTIESKTSGGKNAYGNAKAYVCQGRDVLTAVAAGQIPAGTIIFQTMHGWDYSGGASGNDVGIIRNDNGVLKTFNYKLMSGVLVHESAKKKRNITKDDEVVLIVPKSALKKH